MEQKILEFISLLRRAGLQATLAETMDSLAALKLVDFGRDSFYIALKSTLVKDAAYYPVFDKFFGLYFNESYFAYGQEKDKYLNAGAKAANCNQPENSPACCDGEKSAGQQGNRRGGEPGLHFAHIIQLGSPEDLEAILLEGLESLGELQAKHLYNKEDTLREIKVFLEWKMGEYQLEKQCKLVDEETKLRWQERIQALEKTLLEKLDEKLLAKFGEEALTEILKKTNLNTLDFYRLANNQVAEIKKKLARLAHKLATKAAMGREKARRGQINLQGTIRKSMATGGIPIKPAFMRRKHTKPEIMILCDVSGSVATFSEFMLQFIYSVQTRFLAARTFVFVDTIAEVTAYFRGREVEDAIKDIYNQAVFSKTGFSNYGQVWKSFNQGYLEQVSRKTSLIILGDARNNYQPLELEELAKIKEGVKRIIWLNPEPVERWDKEDSVIREYSKYCLKVHQCRNMEQLEKVLKSIF